ncbi:hypothetical protein HDU97_009975 [Phlyctochytrium planicorne]|nr:hypothetical protein HDU97_009975 [Phlyctochytrium planicorne]
MAERTSNDPLPSPRPQESIHDDAGSFIIAHQSETVIGESNATDITFSAELKNLEQPKKEESLRNPEDCPQNFENMDPDYVRVPLSKTQFTMVFVSLALSVLLAALDQTILTTALDKIVKDLGRQELIPWVGSAYLLSSTSSSVVYGKVSDIFGRKPTFIFAVVVFLLGSILCAVAPTLRFLIFGRAIAGVGGGGIFTLVVVIISDIVSIVDRGKYQAINGGALGLAWMIGPLMGGALSDRASWRYCFWINVPIGVMILVLFSIFMAFPAVKSSIKDNFKRIDFPGSFVLMLSVCCLITPLQLGGSVWEWDAPQTISLFIMSVLLFAFFVYIELKVVLEPIIPASLFTNRSVPAILMIAFLLDASLFPGLFYISLFFQVSYGMTAVKAGLQTIPMILGYVLTVVISGQVLSRTGRYLPFLYIAPMVIIVGLALASTLSNNSNLAQRVGYILITGLGRGCIAQIQILALHASVETAKLAVATCVSQFSQALGGTIGIALMGSLLNNLLSKNIRASPSIMEALGDINPAKVNLPELRETLAEKNSSVLDELIHAFVAAFQVSYRSLIGWAILMLLAAFFVKEYKVKSNKR